ncbi:MAG: hypothetical protein U1A72_15600 [Sulfuritalea sp.]|nr:hypothetical protein [Sulfuritalea sp.]
MRIFALLYEGWRRGYLPDLADVFAFGGLGVACYGIAQFSQPVAWIVGGAVLFGLGVRKGS